MKKGLIFIVVLYLAASSLGAFNEQTKKEIRDYIIKWSSLHSTPETAEIFGDPGECSGEFRLETISANTNIPPDVGETIWDRMCKAAPSEVVPFIYEMLEGQFFDTNTEYCTSYYTRDYDEPVSQSRRHYKSAWHELNSYKNFHKNYSFANWRTIFSLWRNGICVTIRDDFWWFEGRKYLPQMWNDWYTCWKFEMANANVRTSVVEKLAVEGGSLGMYAFPYINAAIQSGDNTLDPLIKEIRGTYDLKIPNSSGFVAWYATNSWKYTMPPCEGIANTRRRLANINPGFVQELSGIVRTNAAGNDISHLGRSFVESFPICESGMSNYYANPPVVPDYWYYKLPDGVEYSAWEEDESTTNFNQRLVQELILLRNGSSGTGQQ